MGREEANNENLRPCTKRNQKCMMVKSSGWPHQNVSIYLCNIKIKNFIYEKVHIFNLVYKLKKKSFAYKDLTNLNFRMF